MRYSALAALAGAVVIAGAPMAQAQATHAPGDPWERVNRAGYAFQNGLDRYFFHPVSVLFRHLSPGPIGLGLHNAIVNLSEPNVFINDVLQLRLKRALIPAGRFVTNSTIGFLGLFDVAAHLGMVHHPNEFGVTLGRYGVGPGPYMYVPLIGPTTVRDLIGTGIDAVIDPMHWASYANRPEISAARAVVSGLDERVMTEAELNSLLADATDPYATLRSVYLQNKQGEIHGESVPIDTLPSFDDPAPAAPPPAPATAGAIPINDEGASLVSGAPSIDLTAPPLDPAAQSAGIVTTGVEHEPPSLAASAAPPARLF